MRRARFAKVASDGERRLQTGAGRLEQNRFRLNRDFALSVCRPHDRVWKVCNSPHEPPLSGPNDERPGTTSGPLQAFALAPDPRG